ncbi:hypothetical protein J6X04_00335 [Candidatus Saccharibacteria bacterium]|nr:hypothetical protein [Candidatus Saccharibacteria bacterium]
MKRILNKFLVFTLLVGFGVSFCLVNPSFAEEESENAAIGGTSISLSPVSNVLALTSNSTYNSKFEVKNDGDNNMEIEVYAAPYSYVYSEQEDAYKLGFSNENSFTQITRWIKFKDSGGNWVSGRPTFTIAAKDSLEIEYRISTPDNIPAGGQYAVIFAHTLTGTISASGIKTEASPGLVIYGRCNEGEVVTKAEISDMKIERHVDENAAIESDFYASAKVKNAGNIDFSAVGTLKVSPIIGFSGYETSDGRGRVSVIPETELTISDVWEEPPSFGIYKVSWTVSAAESTETIEKIVFVNPLPLIIIALLLLTFIIIGIIIMVRRRKERRSRLAI